MSTTTRAPVFVGGCPRSGTSLLGAMLGAHSRVLCVPEANFKFDLLRVRDRAEGNPRALLEAIRGSGRFKAWQITVSPEDTSQGGIGRTCRSVIDWVVERYGRELGKPDPPLWVDHTPSNLHFAQTLVSTFPEARFVHVVRDGRAVAASVIPLDWGPNTIARAATWWLEELGFGLAAECQERLRVERVRFEDLVEEPEETLQRLCRQLDLEYEPAMAKGGGFRPPRYTLEQHALVTTKPDPRRIRSWESSLGDRNVEIFESVTGEVLSYLGYPLRFGLNARKRTTVERVGDTLQALQRELENRWRHRRRSRLVEGSEP